MAAADPTYPFLPLMCILASVLMLCMLLNGFVRQKWNNGVAFLCFWIMVDNVIYAINTIVWADNFELKLYIYCDIASRLHLASFVGEPAATFIIIRRLSSIASLRVIEPLDKEARRKSRFVEWTVGFVFPLVVAGPLYYVVQGERFQISECFGCQEAVALDVLGILLVMMWGPLIPLLSVTIYYPRIAWTFYFHSRNLNHFFSSNNSVPRRSYLRALALASVDVLVTIPVNATNLALTILWGCQQRRGSSEPFYQGWVFVHSGWGPVSGSYDDLRQQHSLTQAYFQYWSAPVLAFVIFGLFGLTYEARASYRRTFHTMARRFGWNPIPNCDQDMHLTTGTIRFVRRTPQISVDTGIGTEPTSAICAQHDTEAQAAHSEGAITTSGTAQPDPESAPPDMRVDAGFEEDRALNDSEAAGARTAT
ncbi:unnamed protein product [Peniophora sp. CBMAI 1063]|nr:unnamed protein product [Peniophora sp. CBMAI 1063]